MALKLQMNKIKRYWVIILGKVENKILAYGNELAERIYGKSFDQLDKNQQEHIKLKVNKDYHTGRFDFL